MDSETFVYIDYVLKGILLIWGCFLCQRVYKIKGCFARFNESKQMAVCIYHTTFLAMCMLLLGLTTKDDPNLYYGCVSAILLENTMLVVSVFYGHPVFKALTARPVDDIKDDSSNHTSSHATPHSATRPSTNKSTNVPHKQSRSQTYLSSKVAVGSANNDGRANPVQDGSIKTMRGNLVERIHETDDIAPTLDDPNSSCGPAESAVT